MNTAITGIRPTGDLTVGNYAGAIQPLANLQEEYQGDIHAFVADFHALTDQPPMVVRDARYNVVRTFMAGGVDPERTNLYLQSDISEPLLKTQLYLSSLLNLGRVTRIPTVKEKLVQAGEDEDNVNAANMGLINYPILMAADIVVQDANDVPVGKDQYAHLEIAREVARRFNSTYGDGGNVLQVPQAYEDTGVSIMSLSGGGKKMSKSDPNGAILLSDTPDAVAQKIKRAVTGTAGEESAQVANYMLLCERLGASAAQLAELRGLYDAHLIGKAVMGQFKAAMTEVVVPFVAGFRERYDSISDAQVREVVKNGADKARENAQAVVTRMEDAMGFLSR